MATFAAIEAETLTFVNEVRVSYGKRPLRRLLKGSPCDGSRCAVARALNVCAPGLVMVSPTYAHIDDAQHHLPPSAQRFVAGFDAGHYPELVKR